MNVDPYVTAILAGALILIVPRLLGGKRVASSIVKQRIDRGAQVVDVRTPQEFGAGAYPGAINIPLQVLASRLNELSRDRPLVVYCASGARSAAAARLLQQAGFTQVTNGGGLADMPR